MEVISAIDIGSNAARLLISEVFDFEGEIHYKKRSLVRVPLRLGEEVFGTGTIPEKKVADILKTMKAYKFLMDVNGSSNYVACATSAMRDARNGDEIVRRIKEQAGIDLHIISGKIEAQILYSSHFEGFLDAEKTSLYIDVGGGSTEITVFKNKKAVNSRSFNIGTIRLKNQMVKSEHWREMKSWVTIHTQDSLDIEAIGSGGNINKLYKLNGSRPDKRISLEELEELYKMLEYHSYEERIMKFGMRADRADVILPATKIFKKIMKWGGCSSVMVPKFGLSDGMLRIVKENRLEVLS